MAAYVAQDAVRALLTGTEPDASLVGISLAAVSLCVMPFLSRLSDGLALHSIAVVADSTQTLLCTYLSAVLLGGLVLNAIVGWGWADPVAGLIIALVAAREGRDALRGGGCCGPAGAATSADHTASDANAAGCASGCCA